MMQHCGRIEMYMKLKEVGFYFVCAFNICLDPFLSLYDDGGLRSKPNLLARCTRCILFKGSNLGHMSLWCHLLYWGPVAGQKLFLKHQALRTIFFYLFNQPIQRKIYFAIEVTISASFSAYTVTVILNFSMIVELLLSYCFL